VLNVNVTIVSAIDKTVNCIPRVKLFSIITRITKSLIPLGTAVSVIEIFPYSTVEPAPVLGIVLL
jgi:hypothetical protein